MSIENFAFKNRLSLDFFDKSGDWNKFSNLELKEYRAYISKIINLSSFNINDINDFVEKVKPPIYYMFSYLKDCCFNRSENVEKPLKFISFNSGSIMNSSIDFFVKIYFFNEDKEEIERYILDYKESKLIIELKFKFGDLANDENALSIIETSIKEKLKKNNSNINFNTDFIKIKIGHIIDHYPFLGKQVIKEYYKKLK